MGVQNKVRFGERSSLNFRAPSRMSIRGAGRSLQLPPPCTLTGWTTTADRTQRVQQNGACMATQR